MVTKLEGGHKLEEIYPGVFRPEMTVVKRIEFDAAHYLPGYKGKCANLHGHHWAIELGVKGKVDSETGMVIDFIKLKDFLKIIEDRFDHSLVNDVISNPTAENIALYVEKEWERASIGGVKLDFIKVRETGDSYVIYRR